MVKKTKGSKTKKRQDIKYPALDQSVNLLSRKDFIEVDYINGLYDENGKEIMRPLTEEEKSWLNKFYSETLITDFLYDNKIRRLHKLKKDLVRDDFVKELERQLKEAKDKQNEDNQIILEEQITNLKKLNKNVYKKEIEEINKEIEKIQKEVLLYPDKNNRKEFYDANNARNRDIYNRAKKRGRLIELDPDEYDKYYSDLVDWLYEDAMAIETDKKLDN